MHASKRHRRHSMNCGNSPESFGIPICRHITTLRLFADATQHVAAKASNDLKRYGSSKREVCRLAGGRTLVRDMSLHVRQAQESKLHVGLMCMIARISAICGRGTDMHLNLQHFCCSPAITDSGLFRLFCAVSSGFGLCATLSRSSAMNLDGQCPQVRLHAQKQVSNNRGS